MKKILSILALLCAVVSVQAQVEVRFNNEASDTLRLTEILNAGVAAHPASNEEAVAFFGRQFIGTPYLAHSLEQEPEMLTVNLDGLDCTTFVETAMALAFTLAENRCSWRDFVYNLQRIRYRGGEVNGYPSRLHYICDWAVDNQHRGNFHDATRNFDRFNVLERSIDFMTSNRSSYPALADSANYARIRSLENGYRQHRFPYIKTVDLGNKVIKSQLRNGDVVALVSATLKNLDVTHMGIIVKDSPTAEPYLLHASSSDGKVEISQVPLAEFMKKNRQWLGIRVFRLSE